LQFSQAFPTQASAVERAISWSDILQPSRSTQIPKSAAAVNWRKMVYDFGLLHPSDHVDLTNSLQPSTAVKKPFAILYTM